MPERRKNNPGSAAVRLPNKSLAVEIRARSRLVAGVTADRLYSPPASRACGHTQRKDRGVVTDPDTQAIHQATYRIDRSRRTGRG
jgi:hypothetical protein